jgi:hypothetical protein
MLASLLALGPRDGEAALILAAWRLPQRVEADEQFVPVQFEPTFHEGRLVHLVISLAAVLVADRQTSARLTIHREALLARVETGQTVANANPP